MSKRSVKGKRALLKLIATMFVIPGSEQISKGATLVATSPYLEVTQQDPFFQGVILVLVGGLTFIVDQFVLDEELDREDIGVIRRLVRRFSPTLFAMFLSRTSVSPPADTGEPDTDPAKEDDPEESDESPAQPDTETVEKPPLPNTVTASGPGERVVLAVYQTTALTDVNGYTPSRTVARYLAEMLNQTNINAEVRYGHDPLSSPTEHPLDGSVGFLQDEQEAENLPVDSDYDLLLTDFGGGGGTRGRTMASGARFIDRNIEYQERGEGRIHANIAGASHELGHAFTVGHDLDAETEGKQHTGMGVMDGDKWIRTPMCVQPGVMNACNEQVDKRESNEVIQRHSYTSCSFSHFEVKPR